jgi:hypothetical protein
LVSVVVVVWVWAVAVVVVVEVTVCVAVTVSVDGVVAVVGAASLPVKPTANASATPATKARISRTPDRRRAEITATSMVLHDIPSGHAARSAFSGRSDPARITRFG